MNEKTAKKPRVLVVDDNPEIIWFVETQLKERRDIEVVTADNGENALKLIEALNFDLIISDLNMPNGDGMWLLSKLKDKAHAPVMIHSGERVPMRKLREMGAIGFLPKPATGERFQAIIDFLLGAP